MNNRNWLITTLRFTVSAFVPVALVMMLTSPRAYADTDKYKRTVETYTIPDVTLVNQTGERIKLRALLTHDKPVMLDFIYGTCTTICPVLSAGYANFQRKTGPGADRARLVSISIDPENDTPEVMLTYLQRYRAQQGWDFLTGTREDINRVMKAFDAYVPDKMSHYPLTLLKTPGSDKWVRIYGLLGTADLLEEYRKLGGK